ncbi:hypothetical protein H0G86_003103 [Trichoderma simmonsii]|uniref:Uncharacterized protein n=1 Tax=Trichoderma simmonsii TaxID=1491479 RepID=A0A8G0L9Y3_9HYPO|nr:hypothetical protein H0G86_003103 [Trichoderma simmonsii]
MDRTAGGVLIAFLLPWSTLRLTPSSPPVLVLISRSIVWKDTRRKPAPLLYVKIFLSIIYHLVSIYIIFSLILCCCIYTYSIPTDTQLGGNTLHSKPQPPQHKPLTLLSQLHNMAFKLLKHLALLFVLLGLALAEYGAVSSEVMATAIHGQRGDSWTYHDNSSSTLNASAHSSPSSIKTSSFNMDRQRLKVELTNIILQEPGFVLLSVSFVLISGGMVFL